jgi:hypothetical protein
LKPSPQRIISLSIAALAVLVPIVVMFWNLAIGGLLLMLGSYVACRAIILSRQTDWSHFGDMELSKLERHKAQQSKTILVQLVDDYGRDLSPNKVQQLMDEAQAKAGPRDAVIGVRYKIPKQTEPK